MMIRRSKVTGAALSTSSTRISAAADGIDDSKKSGIRLEFRSLDCHDTDNQNNSSSDKHRFHQVYARLMRPVVTLCNLTKTSAEMTVTSSKKERKRLSKSSIATYCCFVVAVVLIASQFDAYVREYQGPLDHVTTSIMKPWTEMSCPSFPHHYLDKTESSNSRENYTTWNCNDMLGTQTNNDGDVSTGYHHPSASFPRIFMIGARDENEDTFQSWQSQLLSGGVPNFSSQPFLKRINTLEVSNQFAISGGALREESASYLRLTSTNNNNTTHQISIQHHKNNFLCRKIKWEQRLFYVYQHIFSELLVAYPNDDGFVVIEDDATLLNPNALAEEVCNAHHQKMQFYSLYRSPLQQRRQWWWWRMNSKSSCVYQHGTVAFYIRRQLMKQIVNEHMRSLFCRFPIDMYISNFGPWYATRREIVGHLDRGRIGSSY